MDDIVNKYEAVATTGYNKSRGHSIWVQKLEGKPKELIDKTTAHSASIHKLNNIINDEDKYNYFTFQHDEDKVRNLPNFNILGFK